MTRPTPIGRRAVLRAVAPLFAAAGLAAPAAGTSIREPTLGSDPDGTAPPDGIYRATVDRIVDGEHVVVLIEEDGRVIAQFVVPRERLPGVGEGSRLIVRVRDGALSVLLRL